LLQRLKGAASALSAEPVVQAAERLELLGRDAAVGQLQEALLALEARAAELAVELEALIGEAP